VVTTRHDDKGLLATGENVTAVLDAGVQQRQPADVCDWVSELCVPKIEAIDFERTQLGQVLFVRVRLRDAGEAVIIEARNGGAPIDPVLRQHMFEPFRRGEGDASGLGLGLFIVREIARARGGSVEVHSTVAEGTTFAVTLPKGHEA
jgi:light-regulated signal transduction histidine kinase (bacteriophytochrome)